MNLKENTYTDLNRSERLPRLMYLLAIPTIIFLYFVQWKTYVVYGDDLYIYKQYIQLHTFSEKMNMPALFGKYRPMHGISLQLIIENFQNNVNGYYFFNVCVQSLNTIIFAAILNLFLRSPFFSICFALLIGLSRFAFFDMTQLMNGGALEGMAMTFFLSCLFYVCKIYKKGGDGNSTVMKDLLLALLFSNLCMYTHERYIVLIPFLLLFILAAPALKSLSSKTRIIFIGAAVASVLVNFAIKKYFFAMPFFMGTGGESIDLSVSTAATYFGDGLLSMGMINTGPEYLTGIQFRSINAFQKGLAMLCFLGILTILVLFMFQEIKKSSFKKKYITPELRIFLLLGILFFFFLIPAVITIRLEQRWLQASFSILILMIVVALSRFQYPSRFVRNSLFSVFILIFLLADRNYLVKGAGNIYLKGAESINDVYKRAIDDGTISRFTQNIYIVQKTRDANTENAIRWGLSDGYMFEFYSGRNKKIIFVDSVYQRVKSSQASDIKNFNPKTDQIIYAGTKVYDISAKFLKDTLVNFDGNELEQTGTAVQPLSKPEGISIPAAEFDKYGAEGFYDNENGSRWSNGNSSLSFENGFALGDSLRITLNTFLPPKCKNIVPVVSVIDLQNKKYEAALNSKKNGVFEYKVYVDKDAVVKKILMASDTINALPDRRRLSLPFLGVEVKSIGSK